jgi:hypothetical protein
LLLLQNKNNVMANVMDKQENKQQHHTSEGWYPEP